MTRGELLEFLTKEAVKFREKPDFIDERLRKITISFLKDFAEQGYENAIECIDWLEKQGEKSADKVEPKFHEGDWVIDKQGIVHQIANVIENVTYHTYGYDIVGGGYFNNNTEGVRLWTIQDAKDGDVLAGHETIVLFKKIEGQNIRCYCTYHFMNNPHFYVDTLQSKNPYCPATKEQRDLLFAKMKEAGYEWDDEKKELKKSEEDSPYYDDICEILINLLHSETADVNKDAVQKDLDWLKSLRPQNRWKPSDEQVEALDDAIANCSERYCGTAYRLVSLRQDLNKLKTL